jgi:hypothetical protein
MPVIDDKLIETVPRETIDALVTQIVSAVDDLPILARLQFAGNLVHDNGGMRNTFEQNPMLIAAVEIIAGVRHLLETYPETANLTHRAGQAFPEKRFTLG